MVCKKCKTALEENARVCPYCNTELRAGRRLAAIGTLCGLVAIAGATMLYITRTGDALQEQAAQEQPRQPAGNSSIRTETEDPVPAAPEEQTLRPAPTPTPPPHNADTSRQEAEVWALVENIAVAMNDYYEKNSDTRVIISKNGYMYNYPAKNYFTPKNFARVESMKPEYAEEQALLLYIRPDSLATYMPEAHVAGTDLALYCAYETRDGFAVADGEGRLGIISREDFQKLLAEYSDERGGAFRPENDTEPFNDIIASVGRFKGNDNADRDSYDIRYLVYDEKYAFVVMSEKGAPDRLEEYVLIRDSYDWQVDLHGFEDTFMYQKVINDKYPDFNIGMLPPYNLYYNAKDIRSNISPLIDAMRTQGVVSEEEGDDIFSTGTDKFCYMEFENGKKLLAVYTGADTGWLVHTINNFLHAELIMAEYEKDAPTFILKQ